jgi:hypothetical protein
MRFAYRSTFSSSRSSSIDALVRRVRPTIFIGECLIASIDTDVLGPNARFVLGEGTDGSAKSWTSLLTDFAADDFLVRVS